MARKKNSRKSNVMGGQSPAPAPQPTPAAPIEPVPVGESRPVEKAGSGGEEQKSLPPWVFSIPMWLLVVLALVGVAIGVFLTYHHELQAYAGAEATGHLWGCESTAKVDCDTVNNSPWSEILGVPLATWAIPTYLLIAGLALMAATGRRRVLPLIVAIGVATSLFSVFLYYVSVVELEKVCKWCIRMYFINGATLVLPFLSGRMKQLPGPMLVGVVALAFALTNGVTIVVQQTYRSTLLEGTPDLPELVEEPQTMEPSDPEGPAPVLSWEITTEDKNEGRLLTTSPDDAWKGNRDAKVAIVEFADFECGYCKRSSGQLKRVYEAYKDQVVFIFKHFAMDPACNPGVDNKRHRYACSASIASKCAQRQGFFWAFHDLAFKNQHQLKVEHLRTYAETVGIDMEEFDRCTRENVEAAKAEVIADGEAGKTIDIHGTPRVFINGKLYRAGTSAQQFARQVEIELGATAQEAAASALNVSNERPPIRPIPPDVPEMAVVEFGDLKFKIDTFEASLEQGVAAVGKHQIPATRMSWFAASDACAAAGKRMCTEKEWVAACQGALPVDDDDNGQYADDLIEGNTYPYADYHEVGYCWDGKTDHEKYRPVYTGEMAGCVTAQGVYDLTGNVEEWVGETAEKAVLLGGAYDTDKDHARCYRRNDTFGPGLANVRTGFRCCADAE